MKDSIVTLENGKDYVLLEDITIENRKFYMAVQVDNNDKPTGNYEVFEEHIDGEDTYLEPLEDGDLRNTILIGFTNNYINDVSDLFEETNN